MRVIRALMLGFLVFAGLPSAADSVTQIAVPGTTVDAEALALGREIVANGFPQEMRVPMLSGAMDAMMKQMMAAQGPGNSDPEVRAILDRHRSQMREAMLVVVKRHIPALFDSYAYGYAREFTVEELREIRDFSATPAGQRFISRGSAILSDPAVATANQAYIKESLALIPQFREALTKDLTDYYKKNPEAAEKQ
jgi:hypothetical protein